MRIIGLLAFLSAMLTAGAGSAEHAERAWTAASGSVVSVLPTWPGYNRPGHGAPPGTAPEGTGVAILKPGLIATAAHVVTRATSVEIRDRDGAIAEAEILAVDLDTDIALLRATAAVPPLLIPPIVLAPERPIHGAHVCLIANAFGLELSLTCGVVSAPAVSGIGFNRIEDFVQTDAAANPGASGGALVDGDGRLVGLMSAIFTKNTDTNAGVNFAISSELLRATAERLLKENPL